MTAFRNVHLIAVATLSLTFLCGEWLQHQHASLAVSPCMEAAQVQTAGLRSAVQELCTFQDQAFASATIARWGTFGLTVVVLLLALSAWRRRSIEQPLAWLLDRIQRMGMGSSTDGVTKGVARQPAGLPEVAAVADALVEFNKRLDGALAQMESTSRRTALALVSTRVEHRLELIREYLQAVQGMLESAAQHRLLVPRQAADNLRFVDREILALERALDSQFEAELKRTAPIAQANAARASARRPPVVRPVIRLRDTTSKQPAAGHTA